MGQKGARIENWIKNSEAKNFSEKISWIKNTCRENFCKEKFLGHDSREKNVSNKNYEENFSEPKTQVKKFLDQKI